jgi:hypothetical protein
MAKAFRLPLALTFIALAFPNGPFLRAVVHCAQLFDASGRGPAAFTLRVVDKQTDAGVPNVRVSTDNGITWTRADGSVSWTESSLMGRNVRFERKDDRTNQFDVGAVLSVTPGGQTTLNVRRR